MPTSLTSTLGSIPSKFIEYNMHNKTSNRSHRLFLCCFTTLHLSLRINTLVNYRRLPILKRKKSIMSNVDRIDIVIYLRCDRGSTNKEPTVILTSQFCHG